MSKVTRDLQVTIPREIAERYGIAPGDEVEFVADGDTLRVETPRARSTPLPTPEERLRVFRELIERARARYLENPDPPPLAGEGRGWTRADLYDPPRGWRP